MLSKVPVFQKFFTLLNAPSGSSFTYVAEWFTVGNIEDDSPPKFQLMAKFLKRCRLSVEV